MDLYVMHTGSQDVQNALVLHSAVAWGRLRELPTKGVRGVLVVCAIDSFWLTRDSVAHPRQVFA